MALHYIDKNKILDEIYDETGISEDLILSKLRDRDIVEARTMYIKRLRMEGLSVNRIGKIVGRHHTTVMHALKKHKK